MGKVYLIGAGPGAADLMTVRGARLLGRADVVLHDALIEDEMLALAPPHGPGGSRSASAAGSARRPSISSTSNSSMRRASMRSWCGSRAAIRCCSRRADEEMRALEAAGIEYEVVAGDQRAGARGCRGAQALADAARGSRAASPSSRTAVRRTATRFASARAPIRWCSTWGATVHRRLRRNWSTRAARGSTPVALVEACSTPHERTLTLTLAELASGARAGLARPRAAESRDDRRGVCGAGRSTRGRRERGPCDGRRYRARASSRVGSAGGLKFRVTASARTASRRCQTTSPRVQRRSR